MSDYALELVAFIIQKIFALLLIATPAFAVLAIMRVTPVAEHNELAELVLFLAVLGFAVSIVVCAFGFVLLTD